MIMERDYESNSKAFKAHFDMERLCVVNLLGHKKYEKNLSKLYRDLCVENAIDYVNFDFNKHTANFDELKTLFYEKLSKVLNPIKK